MHRRLTRCSLRNGSHLIKENHGRLALRLKGTWWHLCFTAGLPEMDDPRVGDDCVKVLFQLREEKLWLIRITPAEMAPALSRSLPALRAALDITLQKNVRRTVLIFLSRQTILQFTKQRTIFVHSVHQSK